VYFVFSYSIHHYRVKIAWDEREKEFDALKAQISQIKEALVSDEKWLSNVATKVKATRTKPEAVLKTELEAKIETSSTTEVSKSTTSTVSGSKDTGDSKSSTASAGDKDANFVGSLISGLGGGRVM
jgi:predicted  nucleic acid-binding Zn-ribbon protein